MQHKVHFKLMNCKQNLHSFCFTTYLNSVVSAVIVYCGVLKQQNDCTIGITKLRLLRTDNKNFLLVRLLNVACLNRVGATELMRKM